MSKVPTTVITGFLGAGKTTLIRHLLQNAKGRRLALIVNEFGDVGVDGELLRGCNDEACPEDDIVELANGCICCTVADDFLPTMMKLLDRPNPPEHIIIETSGLALPKPLVKAFQWPDIRTRATVDGVVALIDADAVAAGRFATDEAALALARAADPSLDHDSPLEELYEDQLACADLVILNKSDLVDGDTLTKIETDISGDTRGGVKIVRADHGAVDTAVLLGLFAGAEDDLEARPSHHDADPDHDHDDFDSFVVKGGTVANVAPL
ncbi:MAG TPA: cobalamin biosynthesis protein CobW, partial [Novosphingobium sp.]